MSCVNGFWLHWCLEAGWVEKQDKKKEGAKDNIHAEPVTGEELKLGMNHWEKENMIQTKLPS